MTEHTQLSEASVQEQHDTQQPPDLQPIPQPQPQPQPQPSSEKRNETFPYTCPLCLEEFSERKQLFRVTPCRHLYCSSCIINYYTLSMNERKLNVKCPCPSCTNFIPFCIIKQYLAPTLVLRFQRFIIQDSSPVPDTERRSIWCPGCKGKLRQQKKAGIYKSEVSCFKCRLLICITCGEWAHPGIDCEEAEGTTEKKMESELEQKPMFEQWVKEQWVGDMVKSCPRCNAVIEKSGGCSHMKCYSCRHQFCFVCLQPTRATHCR